MGIKGKIAVILAAIAGTFGATQMAHGYAHAWSCTLTTTQLCADNDPNRGGAGAEYNPWVEATAMNVHGSDNTPYLCVWGITLAGSVKGGSGCVVNPASDIIYACFASSPEFQASVSWGTLSGTRWIAGHASTSRTYC